MQNFLAFFSRSFREASVQMWRNKFLSLTTIALGGLILFLLNFVFAIQFFADYSLKNLESRADFSVELRSDYEVFDLESLQNELKQFDLETRLLPAEKFEDYSIAPRLYIKFSQLEEVSGVFETLKKNRYDQVVGSWDFSSEVDFVNLVERLLKIRNSVESASFWLMILFVGGGVLLIFNAFRIVIFSRRDEIFIARLVGAETRFIAMPFLIEGFLLGLGASVLAIFLFIFVLREMSVLPGAEIFSYFWNTIFSREILVSAIVGVVGAWMGVKKYLLGRIDA